MKWRQGDQFQVLETLHNEFYSLLFGIHLSPSWLTNSSCPFCKLAFWMSYLRIWVGTSSIHVKPKTWQEKNSMNLLRLTWILHNFTYNLLTFIVVSATYVSVLLQSCWIPNFIMKSFASQETLGSGKTVDLATLCCRWSFCIVEFFKGQVFITLTYRYVCPR